MNNIVKILYDHESIIPKEIDRKLLIPLNTTKKLTKIKKYAFVEINGIKYYLTK